jgi:hypothetical protein
VFADAVASRVVWLAAAMARDLATLRTLSLPEFKFGNFAAHFLALLCNLKGVDLSDARGIVARALASDDVEALALLSWAFSWAPLEREWSVREMAVGSNNVHILEALWESVGPSGLFGMSPVMVAIAPTGRDLTKALLSRGSDIEWFSENGECALFRACFEGEAWLDIVEFLCRNLPPGAADLPPGRRPKGPVHWACESKILSIMKAVVERPEVCCEPRRSAGPHWAVLRNRQDI